MTRTQEDRVRDLQSDFWSAAYEYDQLSSHDHSCDSPRVDELADEMNSIRRELDELGEDVGSCPWADEDEDDY